MIELVFNDSEKGAMVCAKELNNVDANCSIGFGLMVEKGAAIPEAEQKLQIERRQREWEVRKPFPGKASDVLSLSFLLDVGDISGDVTDDTRLDVLRMMFRERYGDENEHDTEESLTALWNDTRTDLQQLQQRAGDGEQVRVWYSDMPYSRCGFYHAMHVLSNCNCRVSSIKLPEFVLREDGIVVSWLCWGEMDPVKFGSFLPLEEEIPPNQRLSLAMEWRALQSENKPLRAIVNGHLHGVDSDFYDSFLRRTFVGEYMQVATLIGRTLVKYHLGISDWLLAARIKAMIDAREFVIADENDAFYKCILRKSS